MRIALYIVGALIGISLLVYFFIIKPDQKKGDGNINYQPPPRPINPNGIILPDVMQSQATSRSLEVQEAEVVPGNDPSTYFTGISDSSVNSHNIHTTPDKVYGLIHYSTSFNKSCPAYIWYKSGLYSYVSTKTDEKGNKTCFYKFDSGVLPSQLQIRMTVPPFACKQFKYYLSGVEYKFKEAKTMASMTGTNHFCIYEKQ